MRVSGVRWLKNHFPSNSHSFNLALPEWRLEIKKTIGRLGLNRDDLLRRQSRSGFAFHGRKVIPPGCERLQDTARLSHGRNNNLDQNILAEFGDADGGARGQMFGG